MVKTTQTTHPWRSTLRTIFQAVVGLAAAWGLIIEAAGVSEETPFVAATLAITAAMTRIMALPQVEAWLGRFLPFLAADPSSNPDRVQP